MPILPLHKKGCLIIYRTTQRVKNRRHSPRPCRNQGWSDRCLRLYVADVVPKLQDWNGIRDKPCVCTTYLTMIKPWNNNLPGPGQTWALEATKVVVHDCYRADLFALRLCTAVSTPSPVKCKNRRLACQQVVTAETQVPASSRSS